MRHKTLILVIALTVTAAGIGAQGGPEFSEAKAIAILAEFSRIPPKGGGTILLKGLGFETADQVSAAKLGQPLKHYYVPPGSLKSFDATGDANSLIVDSSRDIYPVIYGNDVKSSVIVSRATEPPRIVGFGRAGLTRLMDAARSSDSQSAGAPKSAYFAVELPDLFIWLLGHRDSRGRLMLTVLLPDTRLPELRVFQSVDARDLFVKLKPFSPK